MAFIDLHFFSESLCMQTSVYVVIPQKSNKGEIGITDREDKDKKYKCMYLLHGLSDDNTIWLRRTCVERLADKYGVCVVMPSADRSFYTDMKYGHKYYQYIAKELPARIREFLNVSDKREDNFVAGLSMGGYGALKIGLRECDGFCACAGLSPVTDMNVRKDNEVCKPIFDGVVPECDDLYKLAEKCTNKPRIYIGIGTEDFLYEEAQPFKKFLEENNFDFTYRESHGVHNWDFWDEYIKYVFEWMFEKK